MTELSHAQLARMMRVARHRRPPSTLAWLLLFALMLAVFTHG